MLLVGDEAAGGALRAAKVVPAADAARLGWEFNLLAGIGHPNVARVHELLRVGERVGEPFRLEPGACVLIEDHADGSPASEASAAVRERERVPWALAVGAAAARALAAVHAAGLVHGDVKPANLVVGSDPAGAVLVDLGLARAPGRSARASGTPAFMAPEAWQGERSVGTDLYALGATLHRLLGGAAPADESRSASVATLVARAFTRRPARETLPPETPGAIARLLDALMDPDPARRPPSSRDVAARLAALAKETGGATHADAAVAGAVDAPAPAERAMAMRALPLAGRDREVDALARAIDAGSHAVVAGPPGAGRTRVVAEAVRRVQGARAAAGRPVPTYVRALGALPDVTLEHDAIVHVEAASLPAVDIEAFTRAAVVAGHSAVVVLERDAIDGPVAMAPRLAAESASRGGPAGQLASSASPGDSAQGSSVGVTIAVGPVSREAVRALLGAVVAKPSDELCEAAMRASGGLPGRLCRLLASGLSAGLDVARPETLAELGTEPTGHALSPAAREVAELLAASGGALAASDVAAVLGAAGRFELLVADGLATLRDDGSLELRSDVFRALRRELPSERIAALAGRLRDRPLAPAARAFVLAALGEQEGAAATFLDAVAERRRAGNPEGAARLARAAIEEPGVAPLPALRLALADALRARGRYADALAALDGPALAGARPGDDRALARAELHRLRGEPAAARDALAVAQDADPRREALLARLALDAGELDEALERSSRVLGGGHDERPATDDPRGEAVLRALEVAASVRLARGEHDEAAGLTDRGVRLARRAGDRAGEARLRSIAASVALASGQVRAAAHGYGEAFALAEAAGELHASASLVVNVGLARLDLGEPGPAMAALREGARRLAVLGRDRDLARALYNLGNAALLAGDDDLARSAVRGAREAAARAGDLTAELYASVVEADVLMRAGDLARAERLLASELARTERRAADAVDVVETYARERAVVAARLALARAAAGDLAGADSAVGTAREAASLDGTDASMVETRIATARVALARGAARAALEEAAAARDAAERLGSYEARLSTALCLGDAADAAGDRDVATRALSDARSLLDAAARSLDSAARARLRDVASYQRALSAAPAEEARAVAGDDRWRRLAAAGRTLAAEPRLGRLYERIAEVAVDLSGAERGFVVMREPEGVLRVRAATGVGRGRLPPEEHGLSRSVVARAIDGGQPMSTVDALRDERLDGAASVHALSLRSVLAVPLRRRGEVEGALYLDDRLRPAAFSADDVALLADLAGLASAALDAAERLRAERRSARRLEAMRRRLARTVETQALEIQTLRRAAGEPLVMAGIISRSDTMQRAVELARRVADSDVPVLITGESGTGKELVARAIHEQGSRRDRPFISENCGAIPETLLESALFGHVRGAFTGADRARAGLFEAADGGTLFLDEIGEMSAAMQAKLLRVVQEGELRPVGSERVRKVDVRIVAATHRDLGEMVARGTFREDLYYRLAVVVIRIPPLRERPEDIPPLIAHLVQKHAAGRPVRVHRRAHDKLTRYAWPGNVRQLENEIQRALVLGGDAIDDEDLSPVVREQSDAPAPDEWDLKGQVDDLERRLIERALRAQHGNQTRAARVLGLSRYGLQKMMKRLGL